LTSDFLAYLEIMGPCFKEMKHFIFEWDC